MMLRTFNAAVVVVSTLLAAPSALAFNVQGNRNTNNGPVLVAVDLLQKPPISRAQVSSRAIEDITMPSTSTSSSSPSSSSLSQIDEVNTFTYGREDSLNVLDDDVDKSNSQFTPFQIAVRATVALTAVTCVLNPAPLDSATASLWEAIYNWGPANAPLFEAEVASFGFFAWIASFSALHLILGKQKAMESRFDGQMPHKPFEWAEPQNFHLWFNPLGSYLGSIWVYHQFLHEKPPLPELAPTFGVFAIELVFGVFLYDLCFFPIHWLMHKSSWGQMRKVHGYHHRLSSHTLNSLETVQHSYIDGFLQVAVNILVQQVTPFGAIGHKHVMSRLAHNLLVTYLLSEAHSGYDLPWMSHRLFPEFLGGASRHEKHHHDGRVYYQQYFKYMDDFFGFTEESLGMKRATSSSKKDEKKDETTSTLAAERI